MEKRIPAWGGCKLEKGDFQEDLMSGKKRGKSKSWHGEGPGPQKELTRASKKKKKKWRGGKVAE